AHVVPVPDGVRVNVQVGAITMDGAALAAGADEPTFLVGTGALVVTGPIERVGLQGIVVVGAVVATRGSEAALAGALRNVVGNVTYYDWVEGQTVKVFQGDTRIRGDLLANPNGGPDDIVLAAGTLLIPSPVPRIGFRQ